MRKTNCYRAHSCLSEPKPFSQKTDIRIDWNYSEIWLHLFKELSKLKRIFHYCAQTYFPCKSDSLASRLQFAFLFSSPTQFFIVSKNILTYSWVWQGGCQLTTDFWLWYLTKGKTQFSILQWGGRELMVLLPGHKQAVSAHSRTCQSLWIRESTKKQVTDRICPFTPLLFILIYCWGIPTYL